MSDMDKDLSRDAGMVSDVTVQDVYEPPACREVGDAAVLTLSGAIAPDDNPFGPPDGSSVSA